MSWVTGLAVYFIIWWVTLFAVLPWKVRTQVEAGHIEPGTNPSSPARSLIIRKLLVNTVIAAVFFSIFYYLKVVAGLTLDDIPLLPRF